MIDVIYFLSVTNSRRENFNQEERCMEKPPSINYRCRLKCNQTIGLKKDKLFLKGEKRREDHDTDISLNERHQNILTSILHSLSCVNMLLPHLVQQECQKEGEMQAHPSICFSSSYRKRVYHRRVIRINRQENQYERTFIIRVFEGFGNFRVVIKSDVYRTMFRRSKFFTRLK